MINESADLNQRVSLALTRNPFLSRKHKLQIVADRGRVTLRGTVGSFFQKQMVQEQLRHVAGVAEIENRLDVVWR